VYLEVPGPGVTFCDDGLYKLNDMDAIKLLEESKCALALPSSTIIAVVTLA
jgi:hypothetical protein